MTNKKEGLACRPTPLFLRNSSPLSNGIFPLTENHLTFTLSKTSKEVKYAFKQNVFKRPDCRSKRGEEKA